MVRSLRLIAFLCFVASNTMALAQEEAKPAAKSKFDQLIEGKTKISGMWTLYQKDQQLLAAFTQTDLKREYIMLPSIAKGISSGSVLGGMSLGFGDDVIWALEKSGEKLFIKRRNVRYRAKAGSPEASAVQMAYSDSIVYAVPILTEGPGGTLLVDLGSVFMNDDQQIGPEIGPGFRLMMDRTTWGKIKAFPENMQISVNAVYGGMYQLDTVPDPKGAQVTVHYSVSVLPPVGANGYKPRLADDRVGYFLTAVKDFSDKNDEEHFIRYINRWNLQKLDPSIDRSPPKEPIKFYIEKTVPVFLRPTVEAGILEWNKAYEKLGFAGAIKVDQEPEGDPNFDPENIQYNTFRWITAEAGFAMGPSRVDPRTGQILDADIIFDASFLDTWNTRYETFGPKEMQALVPNWTPFEQPIEQGKKYVEQLPHRHSAHCSYCQEMQRQNAYANAVLMITDISATGSAPKELIHEGIKEVVMHEVGHTLGLRHNFKASTWKTLEEVNDKSKGLAEGTIASVMDYAPTNITLDKDKQGLYYSQTIGPYDYWAIEYGYKIIDGSEKDELAKIASRSGEPGLAYTTDEDTRSYDSDPLSNRFDLGKDPLEFVRRQMETSTKLLPQVVEKASKEGEGYQKARQAFGLLLGEYWRAAGFAARFPGGVQVSRSHKGDKDGKPPFEVVEPAKQREAMKLIADSAFAAPEIDGKTLNYLAASRWNHWGTSSLFRLDYEIHDIVLEQQSMILSKVLDWTTLDRILDNEFKTEGDDVYTVAEHIKLITDSVFSEWSTKDLKGKEFTTKEPLVDSFRRNLQRETIRRMGYVINTGYGAPADAQTLIRMHLSQLRGKAQNLLKDKEVKLDDYSKAHLLDQVSRINQILNASVTIPGVN